MGQIWLGKKFQAPLCMKSYMYAHTHVCMHARTHANTHTCTHTYTHTHTHTLPVPTSVAVLHPQPRPPALPPRPLATFGCGGWEDPAEAARESKAGYCPDLVKQAAPSEAGGTAGGPEHCTEWSLPDWG